MPTPVGDLLSGRRQAAPAPTAAGQALAGQPAPQPTPGDILAGRAAPAPEAPPPPPSAGPLDPRPLARAAGQVAEAVIPEQVRDVVGWVGGQFSKRLGAMGEVIANPILPQDLSGEAIRGAILSYPFLDPSERATVQSWGPSKPPAPTWAWPNDNPKENALVSVGKRVLQFGRAVGTGETPKGEPANVQDLLAQRGFTEPFGPSVATAEDINRKNLGFPVGSMLRTATSPSAAALAIESAGVPILNKIGGAVAPLPIEAAKQVLNLETRLPKILSKVPVKKVAELAGKSVRTRAMPGVKEALEFFGPEKTLPNAYRRTIEDIQRHREGQASLREFKRMKLLGAEAKLPEQVQDRLATAIEKRDIASLTPGEQLAARKVNLASRSEVIARRGVGLRKFELGAHLEPLRVKVIEALDEVQRNPQSDLAVFKAKRAAKRLQDASGVKIDRRNPLTIALGVRDPARFKGVAFAKRVLTKEKRSELGVKRYGAAVTPSGLGTGKMAKRLSDIKKTSEEINLESIQKKGYRAFEPVVQATLKSGAANDTRVMNAGILTDAVRAFGRPAMRGEKVLGEIYGTKAGFSPRMQKVLDHTHVPEEVHDYLERLNHHLTPERYGRWVNGVRAVNDQFKKWALFSPGFVARNVQNNIIQTAIFGNTDIKNWQEAFHLRRRLARAKSLDDLTKIYVRTSKGGSIRASDYLASAIRRGVIGRGQTAIETGKSLTEGRLNPFRAIRSGNEFAEDVSRLSFDLHLQRSGMSPWDASRKVDQVLFNYSPRFASKGFQRTRRYGIPFVNWLSQIVPLVGRTALERPGSMGIIQSAIEKQNKAQGFTPAATAQLGKDIQDQGGVVVGRTLEGKIKILKPTGYGSYDANSLLAPVLNRDVVGMVDELASRGYPQINVPYSLLRGKDLLTGAKLTGKPVPGPPALKLLFLTPQGKAWAERHGIFQDQRDPGIVRVSDRVNIVLRSIPPVRLASVVADIIKPDKGAGRRAKSFGIGVSEVERNPEQQKFFQFRDTKQGVDEAKKILRRYPPAAWRTVIKQFPPDVQRALISRMPPQ